MKLMRNKYHDSNIHSLIKVHYKLILIAFEFDRQCKNVMAQFIGKKLHSQRML
jgi:hypothetical protein